MTKHTKLLSMVGGALTLAFGLSAPAEAGGDKILVELFTSQGCNSCPPADAMLGKLAERPDVVALSLHVDYWDYLGWKDTFAQPKFTSRQIAYRDARGERVIYTPQMVIQGDERLVGSDAKGVLAAIAEADGAAGKVEIVFEGTASGLSARLIPEGPSRDLQLWYAVYAPERTVEIQRGENAGREITYHNVVSSLNGLGSWQGNEETSLSLPALKAGEGVALWVQEGRAGRVIAAETYLAPGS